MLLTSSSKYTVSNRSIKNNNLFLVDTQTGDIPYGNDAGLGFYYLDTRFLSAYEILLNGTTPVCLLTSSELGYYSTLVFTNTQLEASNWEGQMETVMEETIQLKRESLLDGALFEKYTVTSYHIEPVKLILTMAFDSDFRDMFEIRHLVPYLERDLPPATHDDCSLTFRYDGEFKTMETRILFKDCEPEFLEGGNKVQFTIHPAPLERKQFHLEIHPVSTPKDNKPTKNGLIEIGDFGDALGRVHRFTQSWKNEVTEFISDNEDFNEMITRSHKDLRMLMTQSDAGQHYVAAGVPWYSCLFGRDSIITSRMALIFNPSIAKSTLLILAHYQGTEDNPWRDEQPGKILHELRMGELAQKGVIPHTPYYGSVDATPLWLILLYDYFTWTRDTETLKTLWPNAIKAMEWIDRNLEHSGIGYATYKTTSAIGIIHQGWKDSHNSAMYENGIQAEPPIALVEVQGYVYLAKRRMATLAETMGEKELRARLKQDCIQFKERFNRDFWLDDWGFCALGLDSHGRHLRVVSSNPGHCLETGLFSAAQARQVATRLMAPDMFNGWGIRTLSGETVAYNPMSYHNGSIWPHDNAIIAKGMADIGRADYTDKVFSGLFDAARLMDYKRLPELFCGFSKDPAKSDPPVKYPVACSPQAWAAASPFQLIQSMLNLTPDLANNTLKLTRPQLPHFMNELLIKNLHVGQSVVDMALKRSDNIVTVDVKNRRGKLDIVVKI